MTRPRPNTVILALIAAAAPVLSAAAAIYHERNEAADRQARRDQALLEALLDCVNRQTGTTTENQLNQIPDDGRAPWQRVPLPPAYTINPSKNRDAASRVLDDIARNHGWEEK